MHSDCNLQNRITVRLSFFEANKGINSLPLDVGALNPNFWNIFLTTKRFSCVDIDMSAVSAFSHGPLVCTTDRDRANAICSCSGSMSSFAKNFDTIEFLLTLILRLVVDFFVGGFFGGGSLETGGGLRGVSKSSELLSSFD